MYQGTAMKQSIFRVLEVFLSMDLCQSFYAEHFKMDVAEYTYGSDSEIVISTINSLRLQHLKIL